MLTTPTLLNKVDLRKYDNSLSTAIADSDLVGKTLVVTEAVTCGNVTVPDTIALEILNGGSISVNVGATLSVNGPYDSCVETPFLGSGNVVINSPVKNNNHDNLTGTSVHGLGTASTADVTTSVTDTTAGRLLKVGDFGLGGMYSTPWLENLDLNNITTAGRYPIGLGCANTPSAYYGVLEVIKSADNGYYYQTIHEVTGNYYSYHRNYTPGASWFPWRQIKDSGNILASGAPAQSLANGAIIERGSNANGEYVKFADGTMICNILNLTGTLTAYTVTVWSFPALFVVRPVVLLSWVVVDGLNERICSTQWGSASSVSVIADVTPTTIGYVSCQAIGRWF